MAKIIEAQENPKVANLMSVMGITDRNLIIAKATGKGIDTLKAKAGFDVDDLTDLNGIKARLGYDSLDDLITDAVNLGIDEMTAEEEAKAKSEAQEQPKDSVSAMVSIIELLNTADGIAKVRQMVEEAKAKREADTKEALLDGAKIWIDNHANEVLALMDKYNNGMSADTMAHFMLQLGMRHMTELFECNASSKNGGEQ